MTPRTLKLAADLSLPLDVVTQTIAIIAKRRAGKSYTMRRIVEQLFHAGQQVVLVDPKGDQWGLRSAADGKGPGLPIVILGGEHGDLRTLEPGAGEVVAKLVVEERVSAVLDLSAFRKHEVATFMTAFLENLYRLKAREAFRTPVMLVIDEADAIAPQKPQKGEERMLGAAEDIVRRGGQRGIGCVLVTQRSAVLNKNVLTQAQMLVALRTIAPQDLAAMDAWIQVHGEPAQRKTLMESLPSLPVGDAWFWSPGWPTVDGIFKRVHVLPIETFDSGATPTGQKPIEPKQAADVDLDGLKRQMAATIEKAKADDPRELRKELARVRDELKKAQAVTPSTKQASKVSVQSALTEADRALLEKVAAKIEEAILLHSSDLVLVNERLKNALTLVVGEYVDKVETITGRAQTHVRAIFEATSVQKLLGKLAAVEPDVKPSTTTRQTAQQPLVGQASRSVSRLNASRSAGDAELGKGERIILTACAQYPNGVTREQLTVLTGYARSSRDAYLQRLGQAGYTVQRGTAILATDAGVAVLGDFEPLPTGDELRAYWLRELPEGERRVLEVLVKAYPHAVPRTAIDDATGYARSSRDAYLQRLGARKLIDTERGDVRASQELFS
jgi:hypothetical protein